MRKILSVAWREFSTTVFTKGFIIGIVMTPVMLAIVAGAVTLMKQQKGPQIVGTVAVIDRSGLLEQGIRANFSEQAAQKEDDDAAARTRELASEVAKKTNLDPKNLEQSLPVSPTDAMSERPLLTLEFLPPAASEEEAKKPLETAQIKRRASSPDAAPDGTAAATPRIALLIIEPATVTGDEKGDYPNFRAFYANNLDYQVTGRIQRRVAQAIVDARLSRDSRLAASGLNASQLKKLMAQPGVVAKNVTVGGETDSRGELKMLVPAAFMILLMMSVFTSGQYLLTSTVEEKSNRVMEVLLSAISPMQLMAGKIIGYMAVGILVLVLYGGLGIAALVALALTDLIDPMQLVYLGVFFTIAYFLIASLMVAIGAAVNDMKEAQAMMAPVMVIVMIPWLTWFLIQRAPNSPLATTLSFIPGPNPFVMMIRLCGSEPVPTWQIPASILVGILSVVLAAWGAGKVFRIGALMYGKPPNFKTLWRWIKMA